jgi:hypothetical protein
MKKTIKILSLLITILSTQFVHAQDIEVLSIKHTFDRYKSAILNDSGNKAIQYVDSKTIAYYGRILDLVKTADSTKIETLSIMDKFMVFTLRQSVPNRFIKGFDAKALFSYAVMSGMVGKSSVSNQSISEVTINGNTARGQVMSGDKNTTLFHQFNKEDGQWKIDLTYLFPITNNALIELAKNSGLSQNEYLFAIIQKTTGEAIKSDIWKPVQ